MILGKDVLSEETLVVGGKIFPTGLNSFGDWNIDLRHSMHIAAKLIPFSGDQAGRNM